MKYQNLLFDIDDTLLDFQAAENQALKQLFSDLNVPFTPETKQVYQGINKSLWAAHELGNLTREELLATRFAKFFSQYDKIVDGPKIEANYRSYLNEGHELYENSLELIQNLSPLYELYIVTNGVSITQYQRLKESGLAPYFNQVFISEDLGVNKPMKSFFDQVFAKIPDFNQEQTVIIGDSLTSDIQGGINAGIDTIWLNPEQKKAVNIQPTYQIQHLNQLWTLLQK